MTDHTARDEAETMQANEPSDEWVTPEVTEQTACAEIGAYIFVA